MLHLITLVQDRVGVLTRFALTWNVRELLYVSSGFTYGMGVERPIFAYSRDAHKIAVFLPFAIFKAFSVTFFRKCHFVKKYVEK